MGLKETSSRENAVGESGKTVQRRSFFFWRRFPLENKLANADQVFQQEFDSRSPPRWFYIGSYILMTAAEVGVLYFIATKMSIEWALAAYVVYAGAKAGSDSYVERRNGMMCGWNFHNIAESLEKLGAYDDSPKKKKGNHAKRD